MPKRSSEFIILGLIFVVSRTAVYAMGVRFDAGPLESYVQIVDPELLRTRFGESIWYLHSQPPLFNAFLGIILKLFPAQYVSVFQICYLSMGIVFMLALFSLMKRLGVNRAVNYLLTGLFMISPAVVLYENWLFYTYPVALCLCLAALSLHQYVRSERAKDGFLFFFLLMLLMLLRAIFHVAWLLLILGLLLLRKERRRQVLAVALIPLLIVLAWHVKNALIFKRFTTSSIMLGATVARMAISYLTEEEREQLIKNGSVRKITLVEPGKPMAFNPDYAKYIPIRPTGIPILDDPYRGRLHVPNLNSLYALRMSEIYMKDGLTVLKRYPWAYLKALQRAYFLYVFPGPTDMTVKNRPVLRRYENSYNFMFMHLNEANFPDIRWYSSPKYTVEWDRISRVLFAGVIFYYLGLNIFGLATILKARKNPTDPAFFACLMFICGNILYVTLVVNSLDVVANNRYRFAVDAFYTILLGLFLTQCLANFRARWGKTN